MKFTILLEITDSDLEQVGQEARCNEVGWACLNGIEERLGGTLEVTVTDEDSNTARVKQ